MTTYMTARRLAETMKASGASRATLIDRAERFDAAWRFSEAQAFRDVAKTAPAPLATVIEFPLAVAS